ncbi:hypothetical protein EN871_09855 [bacterium M00.F.Ca.ET.228.01.1.1]|nr:hypothetical protein EN871_09855 [bacterium M00.F.Ca.ET.228.01.1.1]TGS02760.1 hypothetical protein EN834_09850 [bacterium M00.F.Ca.ET.191.01.1.1]TGU06142.1 hypothetical protein EN798_13930 [bacterium M00.F.Ca.ET.155.01.1.1]
MASHPVPRQHRLFIARADWRDAEQYPQAALQDPSIGAWELLRRNSEYARDYGICRRVYADAPAQPRPSDSLSNYVCDPEPDDSQIAYQAYSKRHPKHFVYPVKDGVREKWHINDMPDPAHGWHDILDLTQIHHRHNKLAWLFSCNTADILNPPARWTTPEFAEVIYRVTKTTGVCASNEVLVRLDITGNLDEQIESLRRQLSAFFDGGNRTGTRLADQRLNAQDSDPSARPMLDVDPDWNSSPAKRKTVPYVLRIADAFASLEQGTLIAQLREGGVNDREIGFTEEQIESVTSLDASEWIRQGIGYGLLLEKFYVPVANALEEYFARHPSPWTPASPTSRTILNWIQLARQLIIDQGYILVARTNMRKERGNRGSKTAST